MSLRRLPSTPSLAAFEAAARRGSFQAAAEELGVTPGAVSRQIQALEAALATPLFHRRHKQVGLTERGRDFLEEVRRPLEQIAAATERLRQGAGTEAVAIVAYPTFALRWFIPRWSRFYDRHPRIDIRLTTSLNPADFRVGSFDVALRIKDPEDRAQLIAHDLAPIELFPVCAPPLARRLRAPADLARATLLHSAPRRHDWPRWLQAAGVAAVDGRQGPQFESLNLAFQAALGGLGVAMAIGALVEEDLAAGRLVKPFGFVRRSSRPMQAVYPAAKARAPRVRALIDWLLEEAAPPGK